MGIFMQEYSFFKAFASEEDPILLNVGYHDFSVVQGNRTFYVHKYYTWHFILSGKGTLEIYGKTFPLQSGQMFFIPPHTEMRYYPDEREPWEYVWFALTGAQAEKYGRILGTSEGNPLPPSVPFPKIVHTLRQMIDALKEGGGYFSALSAFYQLMEICTSSAPHTTEREIRQLIDQNFTSPSFSIEGLCAEIPISHTHLLRIFKTAYGITPKKYMLQKRMELACELLSATALSVKSVAHSCGFADELHFMKTFKKFFGISATDYRKEKKSLQR